MNGYIRNTISKMPLVMTHLCLLYLHIASLEQLQKSWRIAKENKNTITSYYIEEMIIHKICFAASPACTSQKKLLSDLLITILKKWNWCKSEKFKKNGKNALINCMLKDNEFVLKRMHGKINLEDLINIKDLIDMGTKYAAIKCIKFLFNKYKQILDWSDKKSADILLNAIKYQWQNINFIQQIIDELVDVKEFLFAYKNESDMIMQSIIDFDLVDIGKRLVNMRWHIITPNDTNFAAFKNGRNEQNNENVSQIHQWFVERKQQKDEANEISIWSTGLSIELDDDDWSDSDGNK